MVGLLIKIQNMEEFRGKNGGEEKKCKKRQRIKGEKSEGKRKKRGD